MKGRQIVYKLVVQTWGTEYDDDDKDTLAAAIVDVLEANHVKRARCIPMRVTEAMQTWKRTGWRLDVGTPDETARMAEIAAHAAVREEQAERISARNVSAEDVEKWIL